MAELKPCPCCGSKDIRRTLEHTHCVIHCAECKLRISRGLFAGKCDTLEEAEETFGRETNEAWNRRADDDR